MIHINSHDLQNFNPAKHDIEFRYKVINITDAKQIQTLKKRTYENVGI